MLEHFAFHYENLSSQALTSFIGRLLEKPLPAPGETLEVDLSTELNTPNNSVNKWRFTRPNEEDSLFEHVDFEPLLEKMCFENILICFASLLVERRTIFVSSKLSTLSSCVQSILALLYPFTWQHICIPVLPSSLLSFCCAPMPFVVGILTNCLQEVLTLPMDEVLIIDVDADKFLKKPASVYEYNLLPDQYWTPVIKAIKDTSKNLATHKKRRAKIAGGDRKMEAELALYDSKRIAKELADVFLNFFVELLGTYRSFIRDREFDREGFIDSQPTWECKQFMELFCGSQMFEMFIDQRKKNQFQSSAFEKRVKMDKLQSNLKQFLHKGGDRSSGSQKPKKILGSILPFGKKKQQNDDTVVISQPTFISTQIKKEFASISIPSPKGSPAVSPHTPTSNSNNNNNNNNNNNISSASSNNNSNTNSPNGRRKNMEETKELLMSGRMGKIVDLTAKKISDLTIDESSGIEFLPMIVSVCLNDNALTTFPSTFLSFFPNLEAVLIKNNAISSIPRFTVTENQLGRVKDLNLGANRLTEFPSSILELANLKNLYLDSNRIVVVPPEIGVLSKIEKLSMRSCQIQVVPPSLAQMKNLRKINFSHNEIADALPPLPNSICLINLRNNKISQIPHFETYTNLLKLTLSKNRISSLPANFGMLTNLISLNLDGNQISDVSSLSTLINLEQLNINSNNISELPDISNMSKLKILSFDNNVISILSPNISNLKKLQFLSGKNNKLIALPREITVILKNLKFLSFTNNPFTNPIPSDVLTNPSMLFLHLQKQ